MKKDTQVWSAGTKSVSPPALKPTLWRTCRVLANRNRLRILQDILCIPGQNVTAMARKFDMPLSVVCKYLREINARGLIKARRETRFVSYHPIPDASVQQSSVLLQALAASFREQKNPIESIFRTVTAFTHQRRIEILAAISSGAKTFSGIRHKTGISTPALVRHLRKLTRHGILQQAEGDEGYAIVDGRSTLQAALLKMALGT
ncbi:MAG: hypothetical protein C0404_02200 [Verrucomicrobia bacterium]|nr:hypothetical protein [Verrucomicrobiota bacterium]